MTRPPLVWPVPGRRVYPNERGDLVLDEGDYGKNSAGEWWCRPPGCQQGQLTGHQILEHEDGSITVTGAIEADPVQLPFRPPPAFHGYLEHGVWRKV